MVEAIDGRQALEAFRREKPQLIVLDLMLPEMDGWEVCRKVRRNSDVPVIMLTARFELSSAVPAPAVSPYSHRYALSTVA